jgi:hypothetical protein
MRWMMLAPLLISPSLLGCPQTSRILPARDRSYTVAKGGRCEEVVWCRVPEDGSRIEECQFVLEPGDAIIPREIRPATGATP